MALQQEARNIAHLKDALTLADRLYRESVRPDSAFPSAVRQNYLDGYYLGKDGKGDPSSIDRLFSGAGYADLIHLSLAQELIAEGYVFTPPPPLHPGTFPADEATRQLVLRLLEKDQEDWGIVPWTYSPSKGVFNQLPGQVVRGLWQNPPQAVPAPPPEPAPPSASYDTIFELKTRTEDLLGYLRTALPPSREAATAQINYETGLLWALKAASAG